MKQQRTNNSRANHDDFVNHLLKPQLHRIGDRNSPKLARWEYRDFFQRKDGKIGYGL